MAEELPTQEELRALPRRAIVAYAARCARRVQPLYRSRNKPHRRAVERAIRVAERFAKDEGLTHAHTLRATKAAAAAEAAAETAAAIASDADTDEVIAAVAAADASRAAAHAADDAAYAYAATAATYPAGADDAAARPVLVASARADYERLRTICPHQHFGAFGDPIDPGENGPLGPLWPNGPPQGWPPPVVKEEAGTEVEGEFARRAKEARPAGLVSVYFDDRGFSAKERLLVLKYLGEVYRDRGGTGFKVAGGSTLVPSREEVAP